MWTNDHPPTFPQTIQTWPCLPLYPSYQHITHLQPQCHSPHKPRGHHNYSNSGLTSQQPTENCPLTSTQFSAYPPSPPHPFQPGALKPFKTLRSLIANRSGGVRPPELTIGDFEWGSHCQGFLGASLTFRLPASRGELIIAAGYASNRASVKNFGDIVALLGMRILCPRDCSCGTFLPKKG